MTDTIDRMLKQGLLEPPAGFAERVMAGIEHAADAGAASENVKLTVDRPLHAAPDGWRRRVVIRDVLEWLALAGAVVAGSAQLVGLLFGLFAFTTAA